MDDYDDRMVTPRGSYNRKLISKSARKYVYKVVEQAANKTP